MKFSNNKRKTTEGLEMDETPKKKSRENAREVTNIDNDLQCYPLKDSMVEATIHSKNMLCKKSIASETIPEKASIDDYDVCKNQIECDSGESDSTNCTETTPLHTALHSDCDSLLSKPTTFPADSKTGLRRQNRNKKGDDAITSPRRSSAFLDSQDTSSPSSQYALYGDIMVSFSSSFVAANIGKNVYRVMKLDDHPKRHVAPYVLASLFMACLTYYPVLLTYIWNKGTQNTTAKDKNDTTDCIWCKMDIRIVFSRLAFGATVIFYSLINIVDFPFTGECNIASKFQGGTVMAVLANISLSFREKMIRLVILFVVGSLVSLQSPHSVYIEDTLPVLGGTILLAGFVVYVGHFRISRGIATVLGTKFLLAAIYVHFTIKAIFVASPNKELSTDHLIVGLVGAGVACVIGILEERWRKQELETLILERTNELQIQNKRLHELNTTLKATETQLRDQNEKLHMVNMALHATETAIAITAQNGRIIWFNPAFERIGKDNRKTEKGDAQPTLIGLGIKDVIHDIDPLRKSNKFILLEALDNVDNDNRNDYSKGLKSSKRYESDIHIGDSMFHLEATPFSYSSNSDEKQTDHRALIVFKDITDARARQQAEKNAQEESMMAKAMADSMVTLTHELRTPLQGIMGITSLLIQGHELSHDAMESLKLIMASSSLLLNLINNLLDVKKATAKMLEKIPLSSVLAECAIKDSIVFCQPLASISDVELVTNTSTGNALVQSNSLRLQQVLINLISNSIKYTSKGSKIIVTTSESTISDVCARMDAALACSKNSISRDVDNSPVLVFSISDNGPGIAKGQAHRLFSQFGQLDAKPGRVLGTSSVGQPAGTGLGLHLCAVFVERMNGHLWATNNDGGRKGATFSFCLPLLSNTASSMNSSCAKPGSSIQKSPGIIDDQTHTINKLRVLLVDDVLINRKVLSRMLKRVGCRNVDTADSGQSALAAMSAAKYDLVITDLQMPGMSGTELSHSIFKSSPGIFELPIVVGLTADTASDVQARCRESGMSTLLYKPITVKEMKDFLETKVRNFEPNVWYEVVMTKKN